MIDSKILTDKFHDKNPAAYRYLSDNIEARDNKIIGLDLFYEILQQIDLSPRPDKLYEWVGVCPRCSQEWVFTFDFAKKLGFISRAFFQCSSCTFSGNSKSHFYRCLLLDEEREKAELEYAEKNIFVEKTENESL